MCVRASVNLIRFISCLSICPVCTDDCVESDNNVEARQAVGCLCCGIWKKRFGLFDNVLHATRTEGSAELLDDFRDGLVNVDLQRHTYSEVGRADCQPQCIYTYIVVAS